jgi:hypothetical protein
VLAKSLISYERSTRGVSDTNLTHSKEIATKLANNSAVLHNHGSLQHHAISTYQRGTLDDDFFGIGDGAADIVSSSGAAAGASGAGLLDNFRAENE